MLTTSGKKNIFSQEVRKDTLTGGNKRYAHKWLAVVSNHLVCHFNITCVL